MKKFVTLFLAVLAVLIFLVGCGQIVDGPGMINTDFEEGY